MIFCYNKIMKSKIAWFLIVILIIFAVFYNFSDKKEINSPKTLKIGGITLNIDVADTDTEREKGLSGREKLTENEGLLFIFEKEGNYDFWMKDMNFPIDIAWLDKDKKIIHIEKNILPETYPEIFNSSGKSLYVLETVAGFFENSKIKIGDSAEF